MTPGLYVARRRADLAHRVSSIRIESVCFSGDRAAVDAGNWRDFIADEHPKDEVFVIEVKATDG